MAREIRPLLLDIGEMARRCNFVSEGRDLPGDKSTSGRL